MTPSTYIDDSGKRVVLGRELGRGGEAAVYAVEGDPSLVAKIYHHALNPEKTEKLSRMVELQTERLLKLTAWPVGILRSKGSLASGVIMRNMSGLKDIHLLYSPKSRVREFPPKANWSFLIHTACNVARAFSVIHEHGHVIGDVNQSNIRVSPESAVVSLIDCDSFQIQYRGRYFLCEVGVPLYTPPELQGKQFKSVLRTPNHDNFGLAVLLFHLLFMGRHPFAGKFLGRGDMPIDKAIGEFRFAFAPDSQRTLMQPPPNCLTLGQLPHGMGQLFLSAFAPSGSQSGRPTGAQWVAAIETFEHELKQCNINPTHTFFRNLTQCPWCAIETQAGVFLFIAQAVPLHGGSQFRMDVAWAKIAAVPNPGPMLHPDFSNLLQTIKPTTQARAAGWKRRAGNVGAIATVTIIFFACIIVGLGGFTFWIALISIGIARSWIKKNRAGRVLFESDLRSAEARLRSAEDRWRSETSEAGFQSKITELRQLVEEHRVLPNVRQQRIRQLELDLYQTQLRRYLEKFDIASADIPHIKDARKAMLSSYGIDDASDVTAANVLAVPGFGQFLTDHLLNWRTSLERKFVFDQKRGVDPADIQRVDQEIGKRRSEIEVLLLRGPLELADIGRRIMNARVALRDQMQKAWMEWAQANANAKAA